MITRARSTGLIAGLFFLLIAGVAHASPPGPITDLIATSGTEEGTVDLSFTVPATGNAPARYYIRYRLNNTITTSAEYDSAYPVEGQPVNFTSPLPNAQGQAQTITVTNLEPGTLYGWSIKSADSAGNFSTISSSASAVATAPCGLDADDGAGTATPLPTTFKAGKVVTTTFTYIVGPNGISTGGKIMLEVPYSFYLPSTGTASSSPGYLAYFSTGATVALTIKNSNKVILTVQSGNLLAGQSIKFFFNALTCQTGAITFRMFSQKQTCGQLKEIAASPNVAVQTADPAYLGIEPNEITTIVNSTTSFAVKIKNYCGQDVNATSNVQFTLEAWRQSSALVVDTNAQLSFTSDMSVNGTSITATINTGQSSKTAYYRINTAAAQPNFISLRYNDLTFGNQVFYLYNVRPISGGITNSSVDKGTLVATQKTVSFDPGNNEQAFVNFKLPEDVSWKVLFSSDSFNSTAATLSGRGINVRVAWNGFADPQPGQPSGIAPPGTYAVRIQVGNDIKDDTCSVTLNTSGIKGTVLIAGSLTPLEDVNVNFFGPTGRYTRTLANGTFQTYGIGPGSYRVNFFKPGYIQQEISVNVTAGSAVNMGTVSLEAAAIYRLYVNRPTASNLPEIIGNARAFTSDYSKQAFGTVRFKTGKTTSDAGDDWNGTPTPYTDLYLEKNTAYKVTIEVPSHATITQSNVTLASAGVTTSTVTLTRQPMVEGRIPIPAGSNTNGIWISVEAAIDANFDKIPDSDDPTTRLYGGAYIPTGDTVGQYRIFGVANGKYVLTTFAPGFVREKINTTVSGSDVTDADFPTLSQGHQISGTITINGDSSVLDSNDGQTDGLVTVPINIFSPGTGQGNFGQIQVSTNGTSTSGAYVIKGFEDGTYTMFINLPGFSYTASGFPSVTVAGADVVKNLTFQQNSGSITGTISLPSSRNDHNTVQIDVLGYNHFGPSPTAVISGTSYTVSHLGTDFYTIRARYPFTGLVVSLESVRVVDGQVTTKNLDLSGATYSISGRVTSTARSPYTISYLVNGSTPTKAYTPNSSPSTLAANRITAKLLRGRNFNDSGPTYSDGFFYDPKETFITTYDANGDFTLTGLAPGSYQLTVNGEIDNDFSNGPEVSTPKSVVLITNQNLTGESLTISDGYTVSGTLRVASGQSESGRSLSVSLRDSNGSTVASDFVFLTGTTADFSIERVQPGDYVLSVSDSYPKKYAAKDLSVEVSESNVSNQEVTLVNASVIKGRLRIKKSGVIISASNFEQYLPSFFNIEARGNKPGAYGRAENPIIDANGYFNIALNPGTYDLVCQVFGGTSDADLASGKISFVPIVKSGISVAEGEVKDVGYLTLAEGTSIGGTITDSAGTPLANIRVRAIDPRRDHNTEELEGFTDANGKYQIRNIDSEGKRFYTIIAAARPDPFDKRFRGDTTSTRYAQQIKGPIDTQITTLVNFTLQPANCTITATIATADDGQILIPFGDDDEKGLPGAMALLNKRPDVPQDNPLGDIMVLVDGDGNLKAAGLAAGVYDLYVLAKGYGSVSKKAITIGTGQTVDVGTLTLPTGYTLSGTIAKSNGDPVNTSMLEDIIASRDNFSTIAIGEVTSDSNGNILSYEIAGIQPSKSYTVLGLTKRNDIISLATVTLDSDTELDLVLETPAPGVLAQTIKNSDGTFSITLKFDDALRNSTIDEDDDGTADDTVPATLSEGNGTLSAATISSDRREVKYTYVPAADDVSFTLAVSATFVSEDDETGENFTTTGSFKFFVGIARQNTVSIANANGGEVDLSQAEDASSFTGQAGMFGNDETKTVDVAFKAADTQSDLTNASSLGTKHRSAALRTAAQLGLKAYPGEMASAMSKIMALEVEPFSSFYDIFLPAGVSHFFPEGKEARLCLTYDASVTDPSTLNIYYYNSATDEYLLESENKAIDTDNRKICVSISHASVFTVLSSSDSVIAGSGYSGELSVLNFPNPFNLKQKTVTLQDPGSGVSASQTIEGTMIKMSIPNDKSGTAEIQIYNVAGELVRTLRQAVTSGAHNYLEWNGRNDAGEKVASGTYIARFTLGNGNEKFFKMAVKK